MIKENIIFKQFLPALFLVVYCISLTPFSIFHNHNDDEYNHHHCYDNHESLYCSSINKDDHVNCSHQSHVNFKVECFLCDYNAISYDLLSYSNVQLENISLTQKTCQLYKKKYSATIYNCSNKSPPVLI